MKSRIIFAVLSILLLLTSVANAGVYFRTDAGLSFFQEQELSLNGVDLDVDAKNPGFNINGAIGFKPNTRSVSGFFGEVETGYSKAAGDLSYTGRERSEVPIEVYMDFVHVFFNVGYEHALKTKALDNPIKIAIYGGAGPVFSEIHADIQNSNGSETQLDNINGDTSLGWQGGVRVAIPIVHDLEFTIGGKYFNSGEHRTTPAVQYRNDSVQATAGFKFYLP